MTTVIYNCKHCKQGKRVEYTAGREKSGQYSWPYRLDEKGARVFPGTNNTGGTDDSKCPSCNRAMKWNYLRAVLVVEHKCDTRCTHARGGTCECSCGGANHGKGWAA